MSRLLLLRLSFLSIRNLVNTKINVLINLSIFVIVFALTASFVSILFENRIEVLESKITKNEINHILYTKWLNKTPKIIIQINNVNLSRKNQKLFSKVITLLPDDEDDNVSSIYSPRSEHYNYFFFLSDFAQINFRFIDMSLTDAILLSDNEKDIYEISKQKSIFLELIKEFDKNRYKMIKYKDNRKINQNWKESGLYYSGYSDFNQKNLEIIQKQKFYFFNFVSKYFKEKRDYYVEKNSNNLKEIKDLASLETKFIFFAFLIQFIIFIILQIMEVTVERGRKNEKN
ncbi:hypothetical protein N8968_03120 [Candidatus Pelagibacter sp.]|nr:hypothetical protein [Candidatus Pelagibacter sp.]